MKHFESQLIGGRLAPVSGSETMTLSSPFSGLPDRTSRFSAPADVDAAIASAQESLAHWSLSDVATRCGALVRLAAAIEARMDAFAAVISAEVGTPPRIAQAVQAGLPVRVLSGFAQDLEAAPATATLGNSTIHYRPLGVIAAITPWNYPLHQSMAKIGAALAAGCTLVLKPSELVPETNELMMAALAEALPPGLVNVVVGGAGIGNCLLRHPAIAAISFTGSGRAGAAIAAAAGEALRPVFLELGGKSAGIVLPDADFDKALKGIVQGGLLNSGQTCTALTRILVPADRLAEAEGKVAALATGMTERLGPLISEAQFERVQGFIARAMADGARCIAGGPGRPEGQDKGFFVRPTVFVADDPTLEIVTEEVFGPVLVIQPYADIEALVRLANGTAYGLAAAVWGKDPAAIDAVISRLRAGQIDVNGAAFNPRAPFGGFGQSGSGREMGLHGIREFQSPVSVQR